MASQTGLPEEQATSTDAQPGRPTVHNGTYTITAPDGRYFTLKLHTVRQGNLKGRRIAALLVGPNNEADYRGIGFWDDDELLVRVWKRYMHAETRLPIDGYHYQHRGWSPEQRKLGVWADLAIRGDKGHWFNEGYRLLNEGHCVVCNRKLTTPQSIERGIGPVCEGRQ